MTNRNPEPSNRQLLIILAIFLGIIGLIFWVLMLLADVAISKIPYSVEQKLGTLIVPIYEKQAQDSPQQETLNILLDRLEKNINSERDYRVLYIPEKTVNAMAIPGDVIIIFEGLIKEIESENELMMILGHELGHFAHRDHLRSLGRSLAIKIAIASIFSDSSTIASSAGIAIENISNSRYSQTQELQADEFGLILLNKTYNNVAGSTDFFKRLSQKDNLNWDFLATHPAPKKRIKALEKLIKEKQYHIGKLTPLPDSLDRVMNNN